MFNKRKTPGLRSLNWAILAVFLLACFPTRPVQALNVIYRVTPGGTTSGSCGDTWANPCALQYAISLAGTADQLWVAAGSYTPTAGTDRTISFTLKSGLAIYGGFAGTESDLSQRDPVTNVTTLSGDIGTTGDTSDNSYHVVYAANVNSAAILDGVTVTGGNANGTNPYDRGGGIFNTYSSPTFNNVTVSANACVYFGGGIYNNNSHPSITNAIITGNSTPQRGGGIYNNLGSLILTNVTISENTSSERGGGMSSYASNLTFNYVAFIHNTSNVSGGGMYTGGGTSTISNSTFSENSAPNGGGMLNASGTVITLDYVTFTDNTVTDRGGGMYNYLSNPVMTNITFTGNTAVTHGGGLFNSGSDPSMTDVTFSNNHSDTWGGGMDNNSSSPTLTNVTFSHNSADLSGGALHNWEYSSPLLTNILFEYNTAVYRGGGMYVVDYCDFTLIDSNFIGNTSQGEGGGVYLSNSNPTFTRVNFIGNSTPANGGGLYNSFTDATLTDVTFSGNTAGVFGGGMENNNTDAIMTNITFSGNSAGERGGGLFNYGSNPVLTNTTFSENIATLWGGAIFNSGGTISFNSPTIVNNEAGSYGGGFGNSGAVTTLNNAILWGNTAGSAGNQIYLFTATNVFVNDSVVQGGCPSGAVCTNIYTTDPLLGALGNNGGFTQTIPIAMLSSALDKASALTSPATDQRGTSRPQGYGDDIGAYELIYEPTAVELLSFSAERAQNAVTLNWQTATEYDNLGFNLYRAAAADGTKTQLNDALIPTNMPPGSLMGAFYTYVDSDGVDPHVTYYYWLEDVSISGGKTLHGPVEVLREAGVFELAAFTAAVIEKSVVLQWQTTNEPETLGFNLYRASGAGGDRLRLSPDLIPTQGIDGGGYTFTDTGMAQETTTYSYWLERIGKDGVTEQFGPQVVEYVVVRPELLAFTATGNHNSILLAWSTGNEANIAGFKLYRSTRLNGSRVLLNKGLIPALKGGTLAGATYTFADTGKDLKQGLNPNQTVYYWLVITHRSGAPEIYGPVEGKLLGRLRHQGRNSDFPWW